MVNGKARDLKQGVLGWNLWKAYYFFCFFPFFIILRRDGLGPKICHDSFFALGMANGMGWDRVSDITRDLIGPLPFTFEGQLVGVEEPGWLCTRHCAELELSHGW